MRARAGDRLLTVGRFAPPQLHSARVAGQPGARQSRQDLRHRAAAELRARCRRIVPGPRTRHPRAAGRGAVRARREPDLSVTRRHRLRQALREGAAARARRHCTSTRQRRAATGTCRLPHALEDWSDARSPDGLATIIQPLVQPHVRQPLGARGTRRPDARSRRSPLARSCGRPGRARCATMMRGRARSRPVSSSYGGRPAARLRQRRGRSAAGQPYPDGQVEIVFRPDPTIHDGSYANNGWLQELPKPLFKTTWENVVAISPALASRARRSTSGDIVEVASDGRAIEGPCLGAPRAAGTASSPCSSATAARARGRIGTGIGYDAYRLRSAASPWLAARHGKARPARHVLLATTQDHHLLDAEGEDIVRTVTPQHPSARREGDGNQDSFYPAVARGQAGVGHGHRPRPLHRLQRLRQSPARLRTTCPVVGKDQVAQRPRNGTGCGSTAIMPATRTSPRPTSSRCRACIASRRRARWAARSMRRCTAPRG